MGLETSRTIVVLALAWSSACTARESPSDDTLGETGTTGDSEGGPATQTASGPGTVGGSSGPDIPPTTGWDETGWGETVSDVTGWDEFGEATGAPTTGSEPDCVDPEPMLQFDGVTPNGFERCADGFIQKTVEATCIVPPTPDTCESGGECSTSAECDDFPDGACIDQGGQLGCGCMYACREHTDCGEGSLCVCTGLEGIPWPTCVAAPECDDPVDCPYSACGLDIRQGGCGNYIHQLACWSPASECRVDDECAPELGCGDVVGASPCEIVGGEWTCNENSEDLCGDCG